jgi:hypothetical protein
MGQALSNSSHVNIARTINIDATGFITVPPSFDKSISKATLDDALTTPR